jgi:hypothetical protein
MTLVVRCRSEPTGFKTDPDLILGDKGGAAVRRVTKMAGY